MDLGCGPPRGRSLLPETGTVLPIRDDIVLYWFFTSFYRGIRGAVRYAAQLPNREEEYEHGVQLHRGQIR